MSRPRRVIGYARVSSAEQALGTSLADQQAAITAYAKARGVAVTRFFVEAQSAIHEKIERREQMLALMRDVREGDLVLCDKLDRWSRDPEFTYGSVRKILAAGASFYAVADRCDPSTSEGDSVLGFRVLFAREEHKRIRERTVGTRNLLRDKGYYVEGTPPFGYRRAKPKGFKGVEKNVLVIEEEKATLIRRAFVLAASGVALGPICEELGLGKKLVCYGLKNRHYLGEIRNSRGEWMRGTHEPIVDAGLFARAGAGLQLRRLNGHARNTPAETDSWVLRDLARCTLCGGKMSGAYAGEHGPGRRHYYRCWHRCTPRFIPVVSVETEVALLIVARLAELHAELARGPEPTAPKRVDFGERRTKIERRRARYLEAHADELTTRDELRAQLQKLDVQRQALDAEEAAANVDGGLSDPALRRAALTELGTLQRAWKRATPACRREIARRLMSACRIAAGRAPEPVWRPLSELVQ